MAARRFSRVAFAVPALRRKVDLSNDSRLIWAVQSRREK